MDPVFGAETLRSVYEQASPDVPPSRFSVPLLIDSVTKRIVCNESALILRDIGGPLFNEFAKFPAVDLYPAALAADIDAVNEEVYESVNNGKVAHRYTIMSSG